MVRRHNNRKRKRRGVGITGLVEPGYGSIYVRTPWMQKIKTLPQNAPKNVQKLRTKKKNLHQPQFSVSTRMKRDVKERRRSIKYRK